MRKGMERLGGLGARADNAAALGYSGTWIGEQAQDGLPSARLRQEFFSRLSGVWHWRSRRMTGFCATSLWRVARSTDVEKVRVMAKVQ